MAALGGLVAYGSLAGARAPEPDRSPHLLIVPDSAPAQATLAATDARVVASYGDFTLVEARGEEDADLRAAGAARRDDLREVSLPGRSDLDPLRERASLAAKGAVEPAEALVLVQFVGPIKDAWLERLRATGARIVEYVAQNGYVVHAGGAEVDRLAGLVGTDPAVRAVTRVAGADKLSGAVGSGGGARPVAIQTVAGAEGQPARRAAAAAGPSMRVPSGVGELRTQFLTLTRAEIETLAADPAVVTIAPAPAPALADEKAAQIVAGNVIAPSAVGSSDYLGWLSGNGFGPSTFGFAIDVTDEGLDNGSATSPGHPDFYVSGNKPGADRVAYAHDYTDDGSAEDCGGHGTNVASIAAGYNDEPGPSNDYNDGSDYNYGLGVAPQVQVGSSKIFACSGAFAPGFSPTAVADAAYAAGARISNNSWSNSNDLGGYNVDSQEYDALVRDARPTAGHDGNQQMVEVFAAGNEGNRGSQTGYGSVTSPGSAKNVITVGASENVRSAGLDGCNVDDSFANSARDILDFSSRGPTDDMRQKPDLVAPGTHVVGASPQHGAYDGGETCNPAFPTSNPFYSLVSGTSQAAPGVSGAAALVRDWYARTHPAPSPALTKALLVNTATDLAGGSDGKGSASMGAAPNADQGWGRVNVGNVLETTEREYLDQSALLSDTGTSDRRGYSVADSGRPVKITLAWTDAPAAVDANPALVNDLDLVVSAGGRTYRGNVLSGGLSRRGGSPDSRNNLEAAVLPAGTSGRFSVRVGATNIAGDGVPEINSDPTDQDFALVVSNANSAAAAPQLADDGTFISDSGAGGDNDGALEPGESVTLGQRIVNEGDASATGIAGVLGGGGGLTVGQGFSAFADAPPGGQSTGQAGFRASLSPTAACGTDVTATLALTTAQGPQSVPVTLATGAPGPATSNSSSAGPMTITDDNSLGVASNLSVGTSGLIKDLDVSITAINHTFVGDLAIELSHGGVTVELTRHPGGPDNAGDNMAGTVFDDEAPLNISQGVAPYTGSFRPQNDQLSRFDGLDKSGTWTLRVRDLFDGDVGTLAGWGTSVRGAVCDVVPLDGTAPAVTLSAPANGSSTADTTPLLSGTAGVAAGDQSKVTTSIYAGSAVSGAPAQVLEAERSASNGAWSREPSVLAPGTYTARAQQADSAGNVGSSAAVTFTVLGPAPSFVIASANERLADALAGRMTVYGACASACRTSATLSMSGKTARRLGVSSRRSSARVTMGRGTKLLRRAGRLSLPVRLTKKARPALRRSDGLTAKLTVEVKVGGRVAMKLDRPVKLSRSAGLSSIARKGMPLWTYCSRSCRLALELWVDARTARGLGLKPKGAKRVKVAAKRANVPSRGSMLTLKMKRSTGAAVARRSRLTAILEAVAGAKPNPTSSTKRSLVLRR